MVPMAHGVRHKKSQGGWLAQDTEPGSITQFRLTVVDWRRQYRIQDWPMDLKLGKGLAPGYWIRNKGLWWSWGS